ncbi:MAG: S-layer homology domain-containing protein [Bacillota bacterium]|jgi:hypothetical protein
MSTSGNRAVIAFCFALCLLLALNVGVGAAVIDSGACGDNLTWTLDDNGTLTVSGTGAMWDFEEGSRSGNTNTASWWSYRGSIRAVRVENGVTGVGKRAFGSDDVGGYGYTALRSVSLSGSVREIRECAFMGASGLTEVSLAEGLKTIGRAAFWSTAVAEIRLPATLTSVADTAFAFTRMREVTIPPSVTHIGNGAFGCNFPCEGGYVPSNGFTIYGYSGTEAERYYKNWFLPKYTEMKNYYANYYEENFPADGTVRFVSLGADPNGTVFSDVKKNDYFGPAVIWAVDHKPQITNGTDRTHFSPNAVCTRAQVVTFLWRAKGEPEPKGNRNPFTDVKPGDYFYKAVLWAVENGVTEGMTKTSFGPNRGCTRAQVVTFLHRAEGKPAAAGKNVFTDVKPGAWYYDAVLWAAGKGITKGTSADRFSPNVTCTRGQTVTFLYRDLK